tara:strand:- start:21715 stop:22470 length:756 start_codon:yes stop_codon:yes gene_type:complete
LKVFLKLKEKPDLRHPVLVGGVADSGYVANLALDHFVKELKGKLFGEIYSYGFPPHIMIQSDGTAGLQKANLYFHRSPDRKTDLLILGGDTQPSEPQAAYQIASEVLQLAKGMGIKKVYTIGAHVTGTAVEDPKIYATATDPNLVKKIADYGFHVMSQGNVTWMNGLLFGLAKLRGMDGCFLSAETSGYSVDAKAARGVLVALTKVLGITMDTTRLDERAKEIERLNHTIDANQRDPAQETESRSPPELYR